MTEQTRLERYDFLSSNPIKEVIVGINEQSLQEELMQWLNKQIVTINDEEKIDYIFNVHDMKTKYIKTRYRDNLPFSTRDYFYTLVGDNLKALGEKGYIRFHRKVFQSNPIGFSLTPHGMDSKFQTFII